MLDLIKCYSKESNAFLDCQQSGSLIKNICHFNDDDVGVDGSENCLCNDDKYDVQQQKS